MRTGIDTNVLVRFLVNDNVAQGRAARKFFGGLDEDNLGYLSLVALVETCWVLSSVYKKPQEAIASALTGLLDSSEIIVQNSVAVRGALLHYDANVDLADALIVSLGIEAGCKNTVTFDKRASKALPTMKLLKE
jgi:predicted nucleic-acid-binding protein